MRNLFYNVYPALPVARILALCVAGLNLIGCGGNESDQAASAKKRVPAVAVEAARTQAITRLLELTGETVAVESVVISATAEGPISHCPWREGDRIERAGEKLIEINRELYRAEVNAAEAALEVARAKLTDLKAGTRPEEIAKASETVRQLEESMTFARTDLDRITRLVESGSLPSEALEKARVEQVTTQARLAAAKQHLEMLEAGQTVTAIAVQEAMVKESQAKLDLAKARLSECVIFAPFAGTITRVHVRAGDMATMKAPLLEMANMASLVIRVAVPETHASAVTPGMRAHVSLDSLPGRTFSAEVLRIYPELDRRMRTRTIELTPNEAAALAPGMFARINLIMESVENAITIPQQAITLTPAGGQVVFVVADGKAAARKVEAGIEQAGRVQVLSGLAPGETVVVSGYEVLKDGMEVRMAEPARAQPQGRAPTSGPGAKEGRTP
ncbi:MAG: efflux RND transporter periplasmic adaptor subunit [Phycisphaerae bacterium]|nr:efflux RND transporter periplasmic adaptor subunit [Phycisphaerae bacterium]